MTVVFKYPHDARVSSNETPDRCLHKLSEEHALSETRVTLGGRSMTDVPVLLLFFCLKCVFVILVLRRVTVKKPVPQKVCGGRQLHDVLL